jgi:hypothetical protein
MLNSRRSRRDVSVDHDCLLKGIGIALTLVVSECNRISPSFRLNTVDIDTDRNTMSLDCTIFGVSFGFDLIGMRVLARIEEFRSELANEVVALAMEKQALPSGSAVERDIVLVGGLLEMKYLSS